MRHRLIFRILPLAIALTALSGCHSRPAETAESPQLLTITSPCAVLYGPDTTKIDRLKKRGPAEDFYTVADDYLQYTAQTREYLEQLHIPIVETSASRFRFVTGAGPATVVDRSADNYYWGLLLFDGQHAPREANLVEPQDDVKAVFGR